MNIFNSLLAQLVRYDVHTTRKIKIDTRYFLSYIIIVIMTERTPTQEKYSEASVN